MARGTKVNQSTMVNSRIPEFVDTGDTTSFNDKNDFPDGTPARVSGRRRKNVFDYSEGVSKRKQVVNTKHRFQTPDMNLTDYISTFFDDDHRKQIDINDVAGEKDTSKRPPTSQSGTFYPLVDTIELESDAWNSIYAPVDDFSNVAMAVQPFLRNDDEDTSVALGVVENQGLGECATLTIQQQNNRVVASPQDRSMARIYQLCDRSGSPRYLADAIIQQLRIETTQNGFDPCHAAVTKRDSFMQRVSNNIGSASPESIPITLESGQVVTVFRFPFLESLQAHLLSAVFSNLDNLSVDLCDPWGKYKTEGNTLADAHDGTFYGMSVDQFYEETPDPFNYCFSPLMGYIDKTGTDGIEKNSLEPWMWISTAIRQNRREDSGSWFPGGFIPNLTMISAASRRAEKGKQYTKSASVRDYHRCLNVILQPFKDLQRTRPLMYFRQGDQVKKLRMACVLAGVVGDNKSQDTLSCRISDYGQTTPRLSRRCLTEYCRSADSIHACFPVSAKSIECLSMGALSCAYGVRKLPKEDVEQSTPLLQFASIPLSDNLDHWVEFLKTLATKAEQKRYLRCRKIRQKLCDGILHQVFGSHSVDNAFFEIDFGSNEEGIFRAAFADILHTLEEGAIPKLLAVVYGLMMDKQRTEIDDYVHYLFGEGHNRSSERTEYPRVSFTRGYTQLTRLSADERVGQLFVLAVLLETRRGRELLKPRFDVLFDEKRERAKARLSRVPSTNNCSASSTEEDDLAELTESDDETINDGDDLLEEVNQVEGYLNGKVKECLDRLDLSYVHNGIGPNLDEFHMNRLNRVIKNVLTSNAISTIRTVQLPQYRLDYRNVRRPQHLTGPQNGLLEQERVQATFKVTKERCNNSIKLEMEQFVYLVETMLSFQAFLKYGCDLLLSRPSSEGEYDKALELFLRLLVTTIDRGESTNQWFLQKTLELAHFKMDILFMGPASGFSMETGERGLKSWAKHPSKTAQK